MIDASFQDDDANNDGIWGLNRRFNLDLDPEQYTWLRSIQDSQDHNYSWGDALKNADDDASRENFYAADRYEFDECYDS